MAEISRVSSLLPRQTRSGLRQSVEAPIPAGTRTVRVQVKMPLAVKQDPAASLTLDVWVGARYYGGQTWEGGNHQAKDGTLNPDPVLSVGPFDEFAGKDQVSIRLQSPVALDAECDLIFDDKGETLNLLTHQSVAFVGSFGFAQTASGSSLTTPTRTSVAGNSVIALCSIFVAAAAIGTPTDSQSNGYTEDREGVGASTFHSSISHAHNIVGGASHTVTVGFTAGAVARINALEYSGMANANPEATNEATGVGTAGINSGAVTASADAMCVSFVTHADSADRVITPTAAGWNERVESEDTAAGMPINAVDKVSAGASETETWTIAALPGGTSWLGMVASYTAAAAGPTITQHPGDQARLIGSTASFSVSATEP